MAKLRLIGVPSSAGAHAPGVERAPAQLRAVGLADALAAAGIAAVDAGDLPVSHFATTAAGVPAGASKPNHVEISNPGTPASAIVGNSGTSFER